MLKSLLKQGYYFLYAIHNNTNHHFLFFRSRLSNHNSQCHQRMISNALLSVFIVKNTVLIQEIEKDSSRNTFVAIAKAMIFGDKIEQIGSFLL